jgi:uncharacterized membrane protein
VDLERGLGRLIAAGTLLSVAFIALGVLAMVLGGRSPLEDGVSGFDPAALPGQVLGGRAEGFLWLGIIVAIATPSARVAAALIGYARRGERVLALVAAAILAVISTGVIVALVTG